MYNMCVQRIKQGDVYWAEYPTPGFEAPYKCRPVLVVSACQHGGDVVVIPMSSRCKCDGKPYNLAVGDVLGTGKRSYVKCAQPTPLPWQALRDDRYITSVPDDVMDRVLRQMLLNFGVDFQAHAQQAEAQPADDAAAMEAESEALLMSDAYPPMQPDPLWDDCDTPTWAV